MSLSPVAQRIQAQLDQRGEKLKPVCDKLGITYPSVHPWWYRPHAKAVYEKVEKFAEYFGVPVEHLMYGEPLSGGRADTSSFHSRVNTLTDENRTALESYLSYLLDQQEDAASDQRQQSGSE